MKQRFDEAYQKVKKSDVWDDPKKKRKLEKLLVELNSLIGDNK
jgi:ParB family chromosome partitioning protein